MSLGGRQQTRSRMLRRAALVAAALVVLALLFLAAGHWIIAVVLALGAAAAIWAYVQLRDVR